MTSVQEDLRIGALRDAAREELARRDLLSFAQRVYPRFEDPPHIRYIARLLERISDGEGKSVCISVPVRHGKSVLCSQAFPAWHLGRHPTDQIVLASHSEALATLHSRIAKHIVEDDRWPFDSVLSSDSASVQRWNLTAGGGMYAIGVGGSVTGRGYSGVGIIDDALHDGLSESESESCWRWFREIFVPRAEPGARLVVIGARLSAADLIGRIAKSEFADRFDFVRLPALAEEGDPLGRKVGEPLWPARVPLDEIELRRSMMGSYAFEAQFQQNPITREGGLFKYDWLVHDRHFPEEFDRIIVAIDPASKATKTADWSAAVVVGAKKGDFFVLDVVRAKVELPEFRRLVVNMCAKWNPGRCLIEDSANGIGAIQDLRRNTALPIVPIKPKGAKIARAEGVVGLFESRRVHLPIEAHWLMTFESELLSFGTGSPGMNDDQVDALVMALNGCRRQATEWSFAFASNSREDQSVVAARGRRLT